ncbi:hypothetical protein [Paenibacillus borealis]|uniref:hypothetical protein n=1 Tax=Paenibacillus borealis TaxID=160799 RepID=UPI001C54E1E9|nr:hypothetical protein [Paenibacillus borealis]
MYTDRNFLRAIHQQEEAESPIPQNTRTQRPAQYFILKGDVIQVIDPNVKQDLREIGKKLTNLRGSL